MNYKTVNVYNNFVFQTESRPFIFSDEVQFPVKRELWINMSSFLFDNVIEFIVACKIQGHHNNVLHLILKCFLCKIHVILVLHMNKKLFHEQCWQCDLTYHWPIFDQKLDCTCGVLYVVTSSHCQVHGSDVLHEAVGNILEHSGSVYPLPPAEEKLSQSYCLTSKLFPHLLSCRFQLSCLNNLVLLWQ